MSVAPLKAVVVDDEEASRETIRNYLNKYCPNVEVKALCESVQTGLKAINAHQPDVVFLDIEMPYGNGFDLLEQLAQVDFEVVFVTAYDNYAIRALNMSAAYYLLKPIDIDELINAVELVSAKKANDNEPVHTRILIENLHSGQLQEKKIVLPQLDGFEVVQVKDIVHCEANDNFTRFHMMDGSKYMICRTLKFFDELLSELDFLRVHKSHLINLRHVTQYKKGKGGMVKMLNEDVVDVSPGGKKLLLAKFNQGR